jgi:GMP synthase (glutamine-hydrolysing)
MSSRTARVLVVQHQETCPPALFADWTARAGLVLDVRRPDRGDPLPDDLAGHRGLLVLGGTMGAHDDDGHPWLPATRRLLRHASDAGHPVLGICLGHQLAAVAFGGSSRPNPRGQTAGVRAIGWRDTASADPLFHALYADREAVVAHWNSDVVTRVPDGVEVLADTGDGAPQVVRFGERAWGVQFHPEVDHAVVSVWADEDRQRGARDDVDVDEALQQVKEAEARLHASGSRVATTFAEIVLGAR